MFIKLSICLCIVLVTYMLGNKKAKSFEQRERVLQEGIVLFKKIKNEIKYMLATVPNALEISRQGLKTNLKDTIGALVVKMMENKNINFELDASIEIDRIDGLTAYDKQILANGISRLGSQDVGSEESLIDNTITMLEMQLEDAKYMKKKNFKLYKTLGVAMGLIIVVILI